MILKYAHAHTIMCPIVLYVIVLLIEYASHTLPMNLKCNGVSALKGIIMLILFGVIYM